MTAGTAATPVDVNDLARKIQDLWDSEFGRPADTALDYRMARTAVEATLAAVTAAAAAQPAPGGCPCCTGLHSDDCSCREDCGVTQCQAADPDYPDVSGGGVPYPPQPAPAVTVTYGTMSPCLIPATKGIPVATAAQPAPGELSRVRADLLQEIAFHGELANDILLNAPESFDGDEAADVIAVRYVRHLEAEVARLGAEQPAPGGELAMLRADIADYEALLARWPKCPAGCSCRIGVDTDPDANECGCDGPCNGGEQPAPGTAPGTLLCDNKPVMDALMRALSDPGSFLSRAPLESLPSWQRRAVIEHVAPLIIAAARPAAGDREAP